MTVRYRQSGKESRLEADYLVCCMSAVMLRQIPVAPAWPAEKRWAIENMPYYTATRPVFQARTKFWKEDGTTASIVFNEPALEHVWSQAEDVETSRGLIAGTAQGGVEAKAALAVFRQRYTGKSENIEHALVIDWSRDPWAMACETTNYRPENCAGSGRASSSRRAASTSRAHTATTSTGARRPPHAPRTAWLSRLTRLDAVRPGTSANARHGCIIGDDEEVRCRFVSRAVAGGQQRHRGLCRALRGLSRQRRARQRQRAGAGGQSAAGGAIRGTVARADPARLSGFGHAVL